tara:strand:+ start:1165 stop:1764 length:600 start_codon:yes stop_codon:yes gene_type:complete
MNKKEKIHAECNRILNSQKENYSVSEMIILVQSQYYNIEDLFTYGANLKSENISEHLTISEEIVSICNSFQNNLKLIPASIMWGDSEYQISRVEGIKSEVSKTLQLQKAAKDFQGSPSTITAQKLQNIREEDIFKNEAITKQEIENQLELLDKEINTIFPAYLEAKKTANWEDSEIAKKYDSLNTKFRTLWSKVAHHYE